jgi:HK97 family phage major capsid protein
MAGVLQEISWELAQDVPAFQAFAVDDMLLAQAMYEENLFVNGTGSGQAQGLVGNVGPGYGPQEPDTNGNTVSITGILNLIGTLNEYYHPGASFLMQRGTGVILRKAQLISNLFFQAFTTIGGQDYLFGYPVNYSAYMPAATRGNTPVIFGDFKRGYIIGDRGGSGINVKVLDQPLASQGLLQLLAYRRTDGRVRRSEALQAYSVSSS